MGNKVFHAPLDQANIQKTLDIGCGTGAVTHEMACTFPNAEVFGADLSPVPQVRQKLSNIQYVQGNIININDARFERNSFDLIFSRLLVLGMSNWKAYVERCVSLAKPGVSELKLRARIEMTNMAYALVRVGSRSTTSLMPYITFLHTSPPSNIYVPMQSAYPRSRPLHTLQTPTNTPHHGFGKRHSASSLR